VTALGVTASSRAAVGRGNLLTAWAVVVVVMHIRVRRVNRVERGNLHWGTPWSADRGSAHIYCPLGSDIDEGYAATTPYRGRIPAVDTVVALTVVPASVLV
jgi:hypothetical protein